MAARLPRHARALLTIFAEATSPLRSEEALRILQKRVSLRSEIAGRLVINHLKKAGLIRFTDITMAEAEVALANAKRIAETLGDDDAPEIPSVGRYEMTDAGRTYLRRRVR